MFIDHSFSGASRRKQQRGVALVVILLALVLVSVMVMAFISKATSSQSIASSSAARYRADMVGRIGLETVIGDLRSEIMAGSEKEGTALYPIYQPLSSFTAIPYRTTTESSPNVLKKSTGEAKFWDGSHFTNSGAPDSPARAGKNNSTATPSANGRFVDPQRWNASYLLGPELPAGFVSPDWVLVTRKGALVDAKNAPPLASLSDPAESNSNFVIGRFSYIIYNEGGLLDVNVAGYPNNASSEFKAKRGLLPQVNLGAIPGVLDANALVQWRNRATSAEVDAYATRVFGAKDGFTTVAAGDQAFVSRQDLIRFVETHPDVLTKEALQYLGTSSRELNAPSYTPEKTRPKVGADDDKFNPSLINTPVQVAFDRLDGTKSKVGEPLIKSRFPLSRLGLISATATASENDLIYKCFGITRASVNDPWLYRNGASKIMTLAEVAQEGKREPDFFELLQAAIAYGSLGVSKVFGTYPSDVKNLDDNTFYQVIQIGANLIDQYDTDSYPTRITFDGGASQGDFSGIENLPYLTRVFTKDYVIANPPNGDFGIWLQPEVWNPHANAIDLSGQPSYFRFIATGTAGGETIKRDIYGVPYVIPKKEFLSSSVQSSVEFLPSASYKEPVYLNSSTVASVTGPGNVFATIGGVSYFGINIGTVSVPLTYLTDTDINHKLMFQLTPDPAITFELQYSTDGNTWVTYDRIRNVAKKYQVYAESRADATTPSSYHMRSDPRSDRFGTGAEYYFRTVSQLGQTVRPLPGANGNLVDGVYLGVLADNLATSAVSYADRDGVIRPGLGAFASGTVKDGYPLATGNLASRPIILNRPFRSVTEMGYASRGMPWKDVDFFHSKSGDAALLDLFSVSDSPTDAVVAGRVDLNTRQGPVLAAVLDGAIRSEENGGSTILAAEAGVYADSLTTLTAGTGGPIKNRADLVSRWMADLPAVPGKTTIKRQREAMLRALTEVGNTRTWNLLIDVIAQSGRFLPKATNLDQFTVDGERRLWLHVAIDRYTGKVIYQYVEPVYE